MNKDSTWTASGNGDGRRSAVCIYGMLAYDSCSTAPAHRVTIEPHDVSFLSIVPIGIALIIISDFYPFDIHVLLLFCAIALLLNFPNLFFSPLFQ